MSGYILAYNTIEGVGLALTFSVLLTVTVHPQLSRLATWYLVMVSGATLALSNLLLAFSGHQGQSTAPFSLCLIQASLIYSTPIWLLLSATAFAVQFHLTTLFYIGKQPGRHISKDNRLIWIFPTGIFVVVTIALLAVGISQPDLVEVDDDGFYCHLKQNIGANSVTVFSVIYAPTAITLEALTCRLLYRYWRISRKLDFRARSNGVISVGTVARLVAFTVAALLAIITCALYLLPSIQNFKLVIIYNALLTQSGLVILGLNRSVVITWMFWRRQRASDESSDTNTLASETASERSIDLHFPAREATMV